MRQAGRKVTNVYFITTIQYYKLTTGFYSRKNKKPYKILY